MKFRVNIHAQYMQGVRQLRKAIARSKEATERVFLEECLAELESGERRSVARFVFYGDGSMLAVAIYADEEDRLKLAKMLKQTIDETKQKHAEHKAEMRKNLRVVK